nr:hypothetical protein [Candidatus Accumulibacter sp. ACC005]
MVSDSRTTGAEPGDNGLEQLVADRVAERVVDRLEAVEVEEHQGDAAVRPPGQRQGLLEAVAQEQAVGQPCQRVVVGQEFGALLRGLALGDVGKCGYGGVSLRRGAGAQGRGIDQYPAHAAVGGAQSHDRFAHFAGFADGDHPGPVLAGKRCSILAQPGRAGGKRNAAGKRFLRVGENFFGGGVGKDQFSRLRPQHQPFGHRRHHATEAALAFVQTVDHLPQLADILLDGDKAGGATLTVLDRCDHGAFVIKRAVATSVLELAMPGVAGLELCPQVGVGGRWRTS